MRGGVVNGAQVVAVAAHEAHWRADLALKEFTASSFSYLHLARARLVHRPPARWFFVYPEVRATSPRLSANGYRVTKVGKTRGPGYATRPMHDMRDLSTTSAVMPRKACAPHSGPPCSRVQQGGQACVS